MLWKALGVGIGVLVISIAGWFGSDALERNNDFCNACHLEPGVPLHIGIRRDFDARPVQSLASLHAAATLPELAERPLSRCIDCHGGVGLAGRARVKALAAKDAFFWLTGHFDEPDGMAHPLGEADCRQCHSTFAGAEAGEEDEYATAFHSWAVHNVELGMDCVECHRVHRGGDDAATFFMDAQHVRSRCASCHSEFRR